MKVGERWEKNRTGSIWRIKKLFKDDIGEGVMIELIVARTEAYSDEENLLRKIFGESEFELGQIETMGRKNLIQDYTKLYD